MPFYKVIIQSLNHHIIIMIKKKMVMTTKEEYFSPFSLSPKL